MLSLLLLAAVISPSSLLYVVFECSDCCIEPIYLHLLAHIVCLCHFSDEKLCTSSLFFFYPLFHMSEFFTRPFQEWYRVPYKEDNLCVYSIDEIVSLELSFEKFFRSSKVLSFYFFFHLLFFDGVHFQYFQVFVIFLFSLCFVSFLIWQFLFFPLFVFFLFYYY